MCHSCVETWQEGLLVFRRAVAIVERANMTPPGPGEKKGGGGVRGSFGRGPKPDFLMFVVDQRQPHSCFFQRHVITSPLKVTQNEQVLVHVLTQRTSKSSKGATANSSVSCQARCTARQRWSLAPPKQAGRSSTVGLVLAEPHRSCELLRACTAPLRSGPSQLTRLAHHLSGHLG